MIAREYWRVVRGRAFAIVFAALLLLGAAVRIYGAWEMRHNLNADAGIVALMAKHMAEGKDFPIFFYGQAYMGSLEPMVSALFCALLDHSLAIYDKFTDKFETVPAAGQMSVWAGGAAASGFMVTLGTAFAGWLVLFAVYLWARDAHSPLAGLAAVAYCMIGPAGFVHYGVSPRGGYAVTVLLGALILWLSSRLIGESVSQYRNFDVATNRTAIRNKTVIPAEAGIQSQEKYLDSHFHGNDRKRDYAQWFLLGVLAGLGWWSNQLVISSILAAAVLGLVCLRWKVFSLNAIFAAAGFFIGSLPFWWWNFLHGWQSFEFSGSFGQTPFLEGIRIFFADRLTDVLDLNQGPLLWGIFRGAVYAGAALFFIAFIWQKARARQSVNNVYLFAALIFIVVSALIFSTSHFARMNTSRYLLPLIPAIAVILGVATAQMAKKNPLWISLIPLVVIIADQATHLGGLAQRGADEKTCQRQIEECGRFLESQGISACYAPYSKHSWNFALNEKICFCGLPQERYLPYARRAELADQVAVIDNFGDITNLVANYGGRAKIYYSRATPVCCGFHAPQEGLAAVMSEEIESIRNSYGEDIPGKVMDGNLDTYWESSVPDGDSEWLEIAFKSPQTVSMIRFLYQNYPETWQIEGQGMGNVWKTLTPCIQTSGYLWSGPRPYWSWGMDTYRLECRIPPEKAKRIRIHGIGNRCRLREMQLFAPAFVPVTEEAALKDLAVKISARGIKRLYCDRWPANAVYCETKGEVQTSLNPSVFGECSLMTSNIVKLTPQTALLVRGENAALCRQVLADRMIEMRRTTISPWVLFDFSPCEALGRSMGEPGKWRKEYGNVELQWAGFACLAGHNKKWAAELVRRADILAASGETGEAITLLKKASEEWALYQPAVKRLERLTEERGNRPEAEYWKSEHRKLQPEINAEIKFAGGIEFAGLSLSTNILSAGDTFTIKYYWKYPAGEIKGRPCVFVHFLCGENILQDDHLLAQFEGSDYQPFPEIFVETRHLVLSKNVPEGQYRIKIGLYDASRKDQRRISAQTALPNKSSSIELPLKLTVKK